MSDFRGLSSLVARPIQTLGAGPQAGTPESQQLPKLAQEFESLLLSQIMQQIRETLSKLGGEESSPIGNELDAMQETIDGELARYLTKAGGFGLSGFLQNALARHPISEQPGKTESSQATQAVAPAPAPAPAGPASQPDASGQAEDEPQVEQHDAMSFAGSVTSGFGWRNDPITHTRRFHGGVDIRAAYGQDVPAAGAGRVVEADEHGGYGLTVVVEHPSGLRTRYAHLSAMSVREGDEVADGQTIGRAGQSGRATGPHVHLELTRNNERLDPEPLVRAARFKKVAVVAD